MSRTEAPRAASRRAASMPRSAIREIMSLAAKKQHVIHLEVGEPDAPTPPHIIESAARAAREGWTGYAPNAGLPALRQAVARRVSGRWATQVAESRVVITTGAIGGLYSALMAVLDPADEVLIPDPGWPNYEAIAHLAGARPVRYGLAAARGFLPDMAEIRRLTTPRTKALLLNTPANPTGAVFPGEVMRALIEHARATGLYVVSDEVYEDMVFEGAHVSAGSLDAADRVFVVSGASKSFAMTGWRLGWLVCPEPLAAVATALQEPVTSCASTITQKAGEAALAGGDECVRAFCARFRRRRDMVVELLGASGLLACVPAGAFYALVDIARTGLDSLTFCKRLLEETSVAAVPGITFGPASDRYVRIAFTASDEDLRTGVTRLMQYVQRT
ncbi:MAG TPA: aminotransferase class I/II-fold pyridoxal phosphate-dependent enzyme [Burkholderiales bacterium]|jgi:aspartate aminotransferase/aminotransferase|nr:aminotransferase class I/II-fold pyridoxal phosphate-dependent enzyme [Burkholderiales bacterium]